MITQLRGPALNTSEQAPEWLPQYVQYTYTGELAGTVKFDWDEANLAHIAAHRVTPGEVKQVYANDPMDLEFRVVDGEDRYTILGHTGKFRVLVVALTMRGDAVRPVTAFDAGRDMCKAYLKSKGYEDA